MQQGDKFKKMRKELGLTREELAVDLGLTVSTIYRYETGRVAKIKKVFFDRLESLLCEQKKAE